MNPEITGEETAALPRLLTTTIDKSACETPVSPPGFLRVIAARRSPPYRYPGSRNGEPRGRSRHSRTGVSGPYLRAISAGEAICDGSVRSFATGSALVPPSAARSDAAAGSTLWPHSRHPVKPCGSPKGRHHRMNRTWAAVGVPQHHRRAGLGFHLTPSSGGWGHSIRRSTPAHPSRKR
jgi:hypothetical protein